ncbi:MAG: hypothetical protein ACYSW6_06140 [Planctomycetota bacterium]|jgi:hypothetical protein
MEEIRDKLKQLRDLLRDGNENYQANQVEDALVGSDDNLRTYITSNELWGGAGSIADQALVDNRESRRKIEAVLSELGEIQMKAGIVNVRTEMWTSAFRQWQQKDL